MWEENFQMKTSTSISSKIVSLFSIILLLALIALVCYQKQDSQIYPPIKDISTCFINNITNKNTILSFIYTFLRLFGVLVISLIISLVIALLYYYNHLIMSFLRPIIIIMKASPLVAVAIYIFIIIRGSSAHIIRPMLICFLVTMPVMLEAAVASIDNMDQNIVLELHVTDASKWKKFFKIYLPLMFPNIITSLLQTIGLGFKVMVTGEYLCQVRRSVGLMIYSAFNVLDMANLIAIIIEIVIIVIIGESIIKYLSKRLKAV